MRFTLIELLVVIAIIAILAAILLPALNSARMRGNSASCINQLKQFGTFTMNYIDENNDYIPHGQDTNDSTWGGFGRPAAWGWYSRLAPYAGVKLQAGQECYNLDTTVRKAGTIFDCPQDDGTTLNNKAVSYSVSDWVSTDLGSVCKDANGIINPKIQLIKQPSTKQFIVDVIKSNDPPVRFLPNPGSAFTSRHNNGSNYVLFDGHVEWMQFDHLKSLGMKHWYTMFSMNQDTTVK